MISRLTRFLVTTGMVLSAVTMTGCAVLQSGTAGVTLTIIEEGFTPPTFRLTDVDMVCNFGLVNGPLVGAARAYYGDPSLLEANLYLTASICSDTQFLQEELRYMRASREKRPDEAADARIAQKRLIALTAQRQYTAFIRMRDKLEKKYFFTYGKTCPKFKRDFDEMTYLNGTIAGLQAIVNDFASEQSNGVSTDIAPQAEFAMRCLDNNKWWGAPMALRASIWSLLPGGDAGKDVAGTFENSMQIGEAKGIRIAHLMAIITAYSKDDNERVRALIKRAAKVPNFKRNQEFALIDAISILAVQNISDRLWTQATGTRTPFNSLGKFWDDKTAASDINTDKFLDEK